MNVAAKVKVSFAMNALILADCIIGAAEWKKLVSRQRFQREVLTYVPNMPIPAVSKICEYDHYRRSYTKDLSVVQHVLVRISRCRATHERQQAHRIVDTKPFVHVDSCIKTSKCGDYNQSNEDDVDDQQCWTMCGWVIIVRMRP